MSKRLLTVRMPLFAMTIAACGTATEPEALERSSSALQTGPAYLVKAISPSWLVPGNGQLYFAHNDSSASSLWITQGTEATTTRVRQFPAGVLLHDPAPSFPGAYFGVTSPDLAGGDLQHALWRTDGTDAGTGIVGGSLSSVAQNPSTLFTVQGGLFFMDRATNSSDWALKQYDGAVSTIDSGSDTGVGPAIKGLKLLGGKPIYPVFESITINNVPQSFGSIRAASGTGSTALVRLQDVVFNWSAWPFQACNHSNEVYTSATEPGGYALWRTDGTVAGTERIMGLPGDPGARIEMPSWFTTIGAKFFFVAASVATNGQPSQPGDRNTLWVSDGSATGTHQVSTGDQRVHAPWALTSQQGVLYFFANTNELWRSDGTTAGTSLVKAGIAGLTDGSTLSAVPGKRALLFAAGTAATGVELWTSDGTPAGTGLLQDIRVGSGSSYPRGFMPAGSLIYFTADDGVNGVSLWALSADAIRQPLTVTCPASVDAPATSSAGAVVSYPSAETANAVGVPVILYSAASGSIFPMGTTAVAVTATDTQGVTAGCSFDVVVADVTAPALTCPSDQTATAIEVSGAIVNYPPATATDPDSAVKIAYDHPSGSLFALGDTKVNVTATDPAQNGASCSFHVTVSAPPVASGGGGGNGGGCASGDPSASGLALLAFARLFRRRR